MVRQLSVICFAALLAFPLMAQTTPPPKPTDARPAADGALFADTAKVIEDEMNGQGQIEWMFTSSYLPGMSTRTDYRISETQLDISTCALTTTETTHYRIEPAAGITYSEGGKKVTGDNLNRQEITLSVTPLKQVVTIKVENAEEAIRRYSRSAHPDTTSEVNPPIFLVILTTGEKDVKFHRELNRGKEAPIIWDEFRGGNRYTFLEKALADRVAQAFQQAVELCGGGKKSPVSAPLGDSH